MPIKQGITDNELDVLDSIITALEENKESKKNKTKEQQKQKVEVANDKTNSNDK